MRPQQKDDFVQRSWNIFGPVQGMALTLMDDFPLDDIETDGTLGTTVGILNNHFNLTAGAVPERF